MEAKTADMYDFECEVVRYNKKESNTVICNLYRSSYMEFYKGTKTTKCTFTIVEFKDKFSCFVHAIDDNKKKGVENEFRGNLLWGFGRPLNYNDMILKISNYTNMDNVKKDFEL